MSNDTKRCGGGAALSRLRSASCWDERCSAPTPPLRLLTSWNALWAQGHPPWCKLLRSGCIAPPASCSGLISSYRLVTSIDIVFLCVLPPSPCRPPRLPPAVPVRTSGLHLFSSAAEERSRLQTMSRQARRPTSAPVLRLAQTTGRTETSRWKEKGKKYRPPPPPPLHSLTPPGVRGRRRDPQ